MERVVPAHEIERKVREIDPNVTLRRSLSTTVAKMDLNPLRSKAAAAYMKNRVELAETNHHANVVAASSYELDSLKNRMDSLNEMLEKEKQNKEANDVLNVDIEKFNADFDNLSDEEARARFMEIKAKYAKYGIRLDLPERAIFGGIKKGDLQSTLNSKKNTLFNNLKSQKLQKKIDEVSRKYHDATVRHDGYNEKFQKSLDRVKEHGLKATEAETSLIKNIVDPKWYRTSAKANKMRGMLDFMDTTKYNDAAFNAQAGKMSSSLFNDIKKIRNLRKLKEQASAMEARASMINESIADTNASFNQLNRNKSALDISLGIGVTEEARKSLQTVEKDRFSLIVDTLKALPASEFDTGDADQNEIKAAFSAIFENAQKPIKTETDLITELNNLYEKYPLFVNSVKSKLRGEGPFQEDILTKLSNSVKSRVDLTLEERTRQLNAIERLRKNSYNVKFNANLRFNMEELIKSNVNLNKVAEAYNKNPANSKAKIDIPINEANLTQRYNEIIKIAKASRTPEQNSVVAEYESMKNVAVKTSRETLNMSNISIGYNRNVGLLNRLAQSKNMNVTFSVPPSLEDLKNLNLLMENSSGADFKKVSGNNKEREALKGIKSALADKLDLNRFTGIIESSLTTLPDAAEIAEGFKEDNVKGYNQYLGEFMTSLSTFMEARGNDKDNTPVGEQIDITNNIAKYGSKEFAAVATYANIFKKIIDPVNIDYKDKDLAKGQKTPFTNDTEAKDYLNQLVESSSMLPELKATLTTFINNKPIQVLKKGKLVDTTDPKDLTNANLQSFLARTIDTFNNSDDLRVSKEAVINKFGLTGVTNPTQLALQLEQLKSFILSDNLSVTPSDTASSLDKKNVLISKIRGNEYSDVFHEELYEDPTLIQGILQTTNVSTDPATYTAYINTLSTTLADIKQKQADNTKKLSTTADPQLLEKYKMFDDQYNTLITQISNKINDFNARAPATTVAAIYDKLVEDPNFEARLTTDLNLPANVDILTAKGDLQTFANLVDETAYDTYVNKITNTKDGANEMTRIQTQLEQFNVLYQAKLDEENRLGITHEYSQYLHNKYIKPTLLMQQKIAGKMEELNKKNNTDFADLKAVANTTRTDLNTLLENINTAVTAYNTQYSELSHLGNEFATNDAPALTSELRLLSGNKDDSNGPVTTNIVELNTNITDEAAKVRNNANITGATATELKTTLPIDTAMNTLINNIDNPANLPAAKNDILAYMRNDSSGAAINAFYKATREIVPPATKALLDSDQEFMTYFGLDAELHTESSSTFAGSKNLTNAFKAAKCFELKSNTALSYTPTGAAAVTLHTILGRVDIKKADPKRDKAMLDNANELNTYVSNVSNAFINITKVDAAVDATATAAAAAPGSTVTAAAEKARLLGLIKGAYTEKNTNNTTSKTAIQNVRGVGDKELKDAITAAQNASNALATFKFDPNGTFKKGNYDFELLNSQIKANESASTQKYLDDYNNLLATSDNTNLKQRKISLLQDKYQYDDLNTKIVEITKFLTSKNINIDPKFDQLQKNIKEITGAIADLPTSNEAQITAKEANINSLKTRYNVDDLSTQYTSLMTYFKSLKIPKNQDLTAHTNKITTVYTSLGNQPVTEKLEEVNDDVDKDMLADKKQKNNILPPKDLGILFNISTKNNGLSNLISNQNQLQKTLQPQPTSGGSRNRKTLTKLRKRARSVMRNKEARASKRSVHRKQKKHYKARKTHRA